MISLIALFMSLALPQEVPEFTPAFNYSISVTSARQQLVDYCKPIIGWNKQAYQLCLDSGGKVNEAVELSRKNDCPQSQVPACAIALELYLKHFRLWQGSVDNVQRATGYNLAKNNLTGKNNKQINKSQEPGVFNKRQMANETFPAKVDKIITVTESQQSALYYRSVLSEMDRVELAVNDMIRLDKETFIQRIFIFNQQKESLLQFYQGELNRKSLSNADLLPSDVIANSDFFSKQLQILLSEFPEICNASQLTTDVINQDNCQHLLPELLAEQFNQQAEKRNEIIQLKISSYLKQREMLKQQVDDVVRSIEELQLTDKLILSNCQLRSAKWLAQVKSDNALIASDLKQAQQNVNSGDNLSDVLEKMATLPQAVDSLDINSCLLFDDLSKELRVLQQQRDEFIVNQQQLLINAQIEIENQTKRLYVSIALGLVTSMLLAIVVVFFIRRKKKV